eukprot:TRINITY_DN48721_c0_g1_i1.p1 TRINITY_DN48721_c0_g1~~TRINITY_DN48721_c0_g1_i1.p1  ORF type:complete len:445 (-),score=31.37 TRINITY_DN48721_c0_g1_i1:231-1565(-)
MHGVPATYIDGDSNGYYIYMDDDWEPEKLLGPKVVFPSEAAAQNELDKIGELWWIARHVALCLPEKWKAVGTRVVNNELIVQWRESRLPKRLPHAIYVVAYNTTAHQVSSMMVFQCSNGSTAACALTELTETLTATIGEVFSLDWTSDLVQTIKDSIVRFQRNSPLKLHFDPKKQFKAWSPVFELPAQDPKVYALHGLSNGLFVPVEVLQEITSWLTPTDCLTARCVCRSWNFLVSFTRLQYVFSHTVQSHSYALADVRLGVRVSTAASLLPTALGGILGAPTGLVYGAVAGGCVLGQSVWKRATRKNHKFGGPTKHRKTRIVAGATVAPLAVTAGIVGGAILGTGLGVQQGCSKVRKGMTKVKEEVVYRKANKAHTHKLNNLFQDWELQDEDHTKCSLLTHQLTNTSEDLLVHKTRWDPASSAFGWNCSHVAEASDFDYSDSE